MNSAETVCIVAPVHIWDDVRVFHKQAISLSLAGYTVVLIARTVDEKIVDGVKIKPAAVVIKGRFGRFLSLPLVFLQALKEKADVYHIHNPDTLVIGLGLKLLGKKVVYDTHEDFTRRILMREWIPRFLRPLVASSIGRLESFAGKVFDVSFATQGAVVDRLGRKCLLVGNPPVNRDSTQKEIVRQAKSIEDDFLGFRLIYIGGLSVSRGLMDMIDALQDVNKEFSARLWLAGPISDEALNDARKKPGWTYVDYVGRVSQPQALAYVSRSHVGLIVIHDLGDHQYTDPNKLYEYMMMGTPFIASNFATWIAKVGEEGAGWFVAPNNPKFLAKCIVDTRARGDDVLRAAGHRGKNFIASYNWDSESLVMLSAYRRLLATDFQ